MQKTQYIKGLQTAMVITGLRVEIPWLYQLIKRLSLKAIQEVFAVRDRFYVYGDQAVQNLKEHVEEIGSQKSNSFFAQFLDPRKKEQYLTSAQISSEAANTIVAGSGTSAVTLTYLIWSVLRPRNQEVREVDG